MQTPTLEKRRHDPCHQSFRQILDLLDLTDDMLDGLCDKCSELPGLGRMILQTLDRVLTAAPRAVFRPAFVALLQEDAETRELAAEVFASTEQGYVPRAAGIRIPRESCASLARSQEGLFARNAPAEPAGAEAFQEEIHPRLRSALGVPVRNYAGHHLHGQTPGLVIGFNYPGRVSRYHGEVIKSLAVTLSALATLARQITEIKEGFLYLIQALTRASEANDEDTGNHVVRINTYAKHLARARRLPEAFCNEIGLVAQMHDVGKIHTPSDILKKPAPLTPAETEIMRQHTLQGEIILGNAPRLAMARRIACSHHENYDGTGYPKGLRGDQIPLEAQIVKIVDVYDALRSARPYKPATEHDEAIAVMTGRGNRVRASHFNPTLLDLFCREAATMGRIYDTLADPRPIS